MLWNAIVTNLRTFHPRSLHKCENGCVFAETKPQSILTTVLELTYEIHVGATQHNGVLVDLAQWFPKYGSKLKQGWWRVKKWALQRRSNPELCVFNVIPLLVFVCRVGTCWEEWNADIQNKLSNLLPQTSNRPTIIIFSYVV